MGSGINEGVKIIIGLVILLGIGAIAFGIYKKVSKNAEQMNNTMDGYTTMVTSEAYTNIDGKTDMSGADVLSFIEAHMGEYVTFEYITNNGGTAKTITAGLTNGATLGNKRGAISKAKQQSNASSGEYINPSAQFTATVTWNSDGNTVDKVVFTQN